MGAAKIPLKIGEWPHSIHSDAASKLIVTLVPQLEQSLVGSALQCIPLPENPILSSGVTLIIHENLRTTKAIPVLIAVFVRLCVRVVLSRICIVGDDRCETVECVGCGVVERRLGLYIYVSAGVVLERIAARSRDERYMESYAQGRFETNGMVGVGG